MQDASAVNIVELEALDQRAIDEGGMRRRKSSMRAPHATCLRGIEVAKRFGKDPAPLQPGAKDRTTERVEHQELNARDHLGGNPFGAQLRDERGHAARVEGVSCLGSP